MTLEQVIAVLAHATRVVDEAYEAGEYHKKIKRMVSNTSADLTRWINDIQDDDDKDRAHFALESWEDYIQMYL